MSNAIVIKKSDGNFFSQLAKSLKSGAGSVARLKPAPNFEEAALDRIVARKLIDSQIGPGNLTYADALYGSTVLLVDPRDRQTRWAGCCCGCMVRMMPPRAMPPTGSAPRCRS